MILLATVLLLTLTCDKRIYRHRLPFSDEGALAIRCCKTGLQVGPLHFLGSFQTNGATPHSTTTYLKRSTVAIRLAATVADPSFGPMKPVPEMEVLMGVFVHSPWFLQSLYHCTPAE